jgi:hypothetical protein
MRELHKKVHITAWVFDASHSAECLKFAGILYVGMNVAYMIQ